MNKIILLLVVVILAINIFMPLSVAQTKNFEGKNLKTNSSRKELQICNMFQGGYPGNYDFELSGYDVGTVNIKKGTEVVFYCPYDFEVGGDRDDVWGYIECLIGGAGYDEVRTGTPKKGRLACSKTYEQDSIIRFKLYLEYTDNWGLTMLKKETKYSNGKIIAKKIYECKINIKREVLDINNLEIQEVNKVSSVVNRIDEIFFLSHWLQEQSQRTKLLPKLLYNFISKCC